MVLLETASMVSKAGTISLAPKTSTVSLPPEALEMNSASLLAPVPSPGKFLGQVVCMRHFISPCEIAGAGKDDVATAPAAAPAVMAFVMN
jgi:hypothetical protein